MASKLNPGADATLVGVAYRAAMANTPGDYSDTLEKVAEGYEKTMEAQSEMWGNIATLGANIGGEMIANAEERTAYAAKAATLNPEDYQFLVDEMYANKDAQKDLGFFGGRFGDRETRQERAELKLKQQELFAEIDLAAESIKAGTDAVANGLYDSNLNEEEAEKVNAIIKSGLKDKHTENRNYAKLSRDKKTGELIYTLYDSDTDEPTMLNGVPQTMTIKEFNKSISNNVKDIDNVTGTNMATIENSMADIGVKSKNGVLNDKDKQLALNQLNNTLKTDADWRRAMRSKWGLSGTSFVEDLSKKGKVSSIIYGQMAQSLGLSGDAQVPAEGIFEGIKDTDGTLGLSLDEVNASYGTYVKNIINMKDPEASKDAFRAVFSDRMDEAHKYGYSKKPPVPGGGTGGKETDNLGIADWTYPEFGRGKLDWKSARGIKRRILNGTTFKYDADGDGVKETYDYIDGNWYENWEDKDNMGTKIGSADDLVFNVLETEHEAFQGLETTPVETATITEEGLPIQTATKEQINKSIFADIDVSNDRSAANALNVRFGLTKRESDVMFSPYGTGPGKMQNDLTSSDIMMYDPQTGKPLRDPKTKEVYSFKIGDEAFVKGSDLNPTVEKIIKILKEQYNVEYDPFKPQE
jgi:hypothetical protein